MSNESTPSVRFEHVTKRFSPTVLGLDDVTLDFAPSPRERSIRCLRSFTAGMQHIRRREFRRRRIEKRRFCAVRTV